MIAIEPTAVYDPTAVPWQIAAWRDTSRICLYGGAAGGGKSRAAAEKLHGFCKKYPKAVGIALRKAREFASKSVVYALQRAIGDDPTVRYNASDLMFHYSNGSKIFVAGMKDEGQRQALRSINGDGSADFIWCEEANALTEDDYNELLGRLRGKAAPWRQILLTTNPDAPTHWIKTRLMDGGEASVHYSSATDNPHLPPEYIETLKSITGVLGMRLRDGLWVQAEGVVYPDYADALHVVSALPTGWQSWRKIRVIDFGYVNPFVCQWWAIDHDGCMYRYREIYMTKRTVAEHAEKIKLFSQGEQYEATIADHDAEDRATLKQHGIHTISALKDVSRGIQAVQQRLARGADDKPRLYLLKNALVERDAQLVEERKPFCTEQEFPAYVWQTTPDGKPDKEEPLKVNDHGCLIGETMINTPQGHRNLRDIRRGDYVAGRNGWVRVQDAAMTQAAALIYCVKLANGATLYGTYDHPIYTENRGYINTDALHYGDMVWYNYSGEREELCYPSHIETARPKSLFTRVSSFVAILNQSVMETHGIIVRQLRTRCAALTSCIARFTKTILARFHRGMKFTTGTETRSITRSQIWNAYPDRHTAICTRNSLPSPIFDGGANGSWKRRTSRQGTGTSRKKGASGIANTGAPYMQSDSLSSWFAPTAEASMKARSVMGMLIAPTSAGRRRGAPAVLTTKHAYANDAGSPSQSTDIASNDIALVPVVAVSAMNERKPVYNLTVDGGEYYANGVLVHNCDALRYAVMYLDGKPPRRTGGSYSG